MGSKSRKRKALARLSDELADRIAQSPLPKVEAVKVIGELRMRTNPPRKMAGRKADWVLSVEASGSQKIGGDRALHVMQTPAEKAMNARIRKSRTVRGLTNNNGYTQYPTNADTIVAGVSEPGIHHGLHRVRVTSE